MPVSDSKDDLSMFARFSHEIYLYVPATQLLVFQVFDNMTRKLRVEKFGRNDWEKNEKNAHTHTWYLYAYIPHEPMMGKIYVHSGSRHVSLHISARVTVNFAAK